MNDIEIDRLEREVERSIYRESYYEFFKKAFCQLHPGLEYDENWHAKYLCDRLQDEFDRIKRGEERKQDIIINMPFRAAKSMITTVIFPAWCWSQDPTMKFITVSYSGDLALEHSKRTKDLINTVWYQRLYGNKVILKADTRAAGHYETIDGGMRKAVGTGGQITGSGADIIILDDPLNPKQAASEAEREGAKRFYDHTLYSRLNQPDIGVRIIVMQRLHECLHPSTLVSTPNGFKEICEIQSGDIVISSLGLDEVKWQSSSMYEGHIISIKLSDKGGPLVCTPEHLILSNGNWVKAKYIKEGDYIDDISFNSSPMKRVPAKRKVVSVNTEPYEGWVYDITTNSGNFTVSQGDSCITVHNSDLSGHLMEKRPEDHQHICLPACLDNEKDRKMLSPKSVEEYYVDGLFWATRFNRPTLRSFEKSLGAVQAAGQLQQRPAPAEGNILRRNWFPIAKPTDVSRNPNRDYIHFLLDTAYTDKQENDPTGIMSVFKKDGKIYIVNAMSVYKEFHQLLEWAPKYMKVNGYTKYSRVSVEPKASGKSLVQQLKNQTDFNVSEITGDFLRDSKVTRANSIQPIIQSGRVVLIEGPWNEEFLDQVTTFPNASHDEYVDLLCYAVEIYLNNSDLSWGFA